jgi:Flp pilus assembly protein TadG
MKQRRRFTAQNLVEFALVGPIFFLLVFGLIEGGRLVWTMHTLSNATKEGSRYAIVRGSYSTLPGAPATSAGTEAAMLAKAPGLDGSKLTVNVDYPDGSADPKNRVRVTSRYNYSFIVSAVFGLSSITLNASSEATIAH